MVRNESKKLGFHAPKKKARRKKVGEHKLGMKSRYRGVSDYG